MASADVDTFFQWMALGTSPLARSGTTERTAETETSEYAMGLLLESSSDEDDDVSWDLDEADDAHVFGVPPHPTLFENFSARAPRRLLGARGPLVVAIEGAAGTGTTALCAWLRAILTQQFQRRVRVARGLDVLSSTRPSSPRLHRLTRDPCAQLTTPSSTKHMLRVLNRIELWDELTQEVLRDGMRRAPEIILLDRYTLSGVVDAHYDNCVPNVCRMQDSFCAAPTFTVYLRMCPAAIAARVGDLHSDTVAEAALYECIARAVWRGSDRLAHVGPLVDVDADELTLDQLGTRVLSFIMGALTLGVEG